MKIEAYSFGRMEIAGTVYTSDLILFPDRIFSPWWRLEGHLLQRDDLASVIEESPELLIVGTGYSGMMGVPAALIKSLEALGIRVIVRKTSGAVESFNEERTARKAAAFHLTC